MKWKFIEVVSRFSIFHVFNKCSNKKMKNIVLYFVFVMEGKG